MSNLINYGLFQAGWFTCVLGAAHGYPGLAACAGFALVVIHLLLVQDVAQESLLLGFALILGMVVDGVHIQTGVLIFPIGSAVSWLPPPWILVLWLQFAMTLHFSLHWLSGKWIVGGILGGFAGSLAYWAGVRLGAAEFGEPLSRSLLQIGTAWVSVMIVLLWMAERTKVKSLIGSYRIFKKR